jgi:hypothetical protein
MAEAKGRSIAGRLELVGRKPEETAPALALVVMDASGKRAATAKVQEDGSFTLPARARDVGARVLIGPADADPDDADARFLTYRLGDLERLLELGPIILPEDRWRPILYWHCVSGSVRRCYPFPHWLDEIRLSGVSLGAASIRSLSPVTPSSIIFPWRCGTVCQGLVEVYRRTCCCEPPIIWPELDPPILWPDDPPIPIPDPPWPVPWPPDPGPIPFPPPGPGPDPVPFAALEQVATSGTLDVRKLNRERDAVALRALKGEPLAEYIRLRPYLWCHCGGATKVAQGLIADDGTFSTCWPGWPIFPAPNCRIEYAYKVSQSIDGADVTIYDGVAGNQWFGQGETPVLTSYSPWAKTCVGDPEIPGLGDAIVLLHEIGATESHSLATPLQDGPESVQAPAWNSGLLNPAVMDGPGANRNLGGSLGLRYFFSSGVKGIGGRFFRVQVAAADAGGDAAGPWTTVPVPVWKAWRWTGGGWVRSQHALGPNADGLYVIPYEDVDLLGSLEEWDPDQYHAILDSTQHLNRRHLVKIEVFDAAGNQIKPNGATGPGTARNYRFGLWRVPAGPPDNVPFSALTHLLWWDNRSAQAKIEAIRLGGTPSSATCQFLEGGAGDAVSFDIQAYHPNPGTPLFVRGYSLNVTKGLGGSPQSIVSAFSEVGEPPAGPATSPSKTLAALLGGDTKCAFSARLSVGVKTTNGSGTLTGLDAEDTAAFAAEITED